MPCFLPNIYSKTASESTRFLQRLVISSIATFPSNAIKVPGELIKQRAQTRPGQNSWKLFLEAIREDGVGGLYVGVNAQLLREIPYNAIQMSTFDLLKDTVAKSAATATATVAATTTTSITINDVSTQDMHLNFFQFVKELDPTIEAAVLGLIAAAVAASLTQPFDVIKTQLMTAKATRPTVFSCLQDILQRFVSIACI